MDSETKEIKREVVETEYWVYRTNCIVCNKEINLNYNDGELDSQECCGHIYSLQIKDIEFVVTKLVNAEPSIKAEV